tara:strand:- start:264 stop:473 length:210 start_codon:yes stop_codon:yes gene_type:complete
MIGAIIAGIWTLTSYMDTKKKECYTDFWNIKMSLFKKTSIAISRFLRPARRCETGPSARFLPEASNIAA